MKKGASQSRRRSAPPGVLNHIHGALRISCVADDRMPGVSQMNPNLMRPARLDFDFKEAESGKSLPDAIKSKRFPALALSTNGHLDPIVRIPSDRCVNSSCIC